MSGSPESTPHIIRARKALVDALAELREARLAHEADATALANFSRVVRNVDDALEAIEIR